MPNKNPKLIEIKENIHHVIANLQQLEQLISEAGHDFDLKHAEELQRSTTTLLDALDQVPVQKVAGVQKKRRRRRHLAKQKKKRVKCENIKTEGHLGLERKHSVEPPRNPTVKQAEHISLRKRHDAASILETFDLLEKLCESRSGNKVALSQRLAQMRHLWRRVLEENKQETVKESVKASSIGAQWDLVFFGKSSLADRDSKGKFLETRSTWDSYISLGGNGSCIPRGWVLPPIKPTAPWAAFRTET